MAATVLISAIEAHPGHRELPGGAHETYCVLCGEPATLAADGGWTCGGACEPGRAKGALVDWYQHDWLPGQANGDGRAPVALKWPKLPGHDASPGELRRYLTTCCGLPARWSIERAHRWGPEAADPMVMWVRAPGRQHDYGVRWDHQEDAGRPGTLRATISRCTAGHARMRHPTGAQAQDFFTILCALATVDEKATVADETRAWLEDFTHQTRPIVGHSIADGERRYDALAVLRIREFTRPEAQALIRGDLDPDRRPALLVDDLTGESWIRTGELATYLRWVYGVKGGLAQSTLDARLAEIGVERVYCQVNRASGHQKLVLYCAPPEA